MRVTPVLERVPEKLAEDSASAVARCPASSTSASDAVTSLPATRPWTSIDRSRSIELVQIDDVLAVLGEHLVDGGDREDAVHRVAERLLRIDPFGARLQPEQRGDGLQVVLDAMMDLLSEDTAKRHPPVLERHRRLVRDRIEQLAVVVGERGVAVDDELTDLRVRASAGASRTACAPARPSGQAMRPSSSTTAAPVARSDSTVVCTIASSDSSR